MIRYQKGSVAILCWDENRLWLGSGGLKCENPVLKFERKSHPDHWGGPIDPKLCGPSIYVHQTWSASKKSHFRTFAPSTPSGVFHVHEHAFMRTCVHEHAGPDFTSTCTRT